MQKIWLKNNPKGVKESVNLEEYKSFADFWFAFRKPWMAFSEDPNLGPLNSSITFGCLAGIFSILITTIVSIYTASKEEKIDTLKILKYE